MSTASHHVQQLVTLVEQLRQTGRDATASALLSVLSSHQLKGDRSFLIELLHHPDLIMKLCLSHDIFVRFTLQRLVSSMLCLRFLDSEERVGGSSLFSSQVALLAKILSTLLLLDDTTTPPAATTIETRQLLLEICHWVLKDARTLLKTLKQSQNSHLQQDAGDMDPLCHVGLVLQERIQHITLGSSHTTSLSIASQIAQLLQSPNLQYPTLVFLIDLEKNTRLRQSSSSNSCTFTHHRCLTLDCIDQVLNLSMYEPKCLRKVLQLLNIHLQPPTPAIIRPTSGVHHRDDNHNIQDDKQIPWTSAEENVKVIQLLAHHAIGMRRILTNPDDRAHLRQLAPITKNATTTHFVSMQGSNTSSQLATYNHGHNDDLLFFTRCALQDPEALRGLVRVFCQSALNGLDGILLLLSSSTPGSSDHAESWARVLDAWIDNILDFCRHCDWVAAAYFLIHLHSGRMQDDGNDNSSNQDEMEGGELFWKVALSLFGDDDADVAWLLYTTFELMRKLQEVVQQIQTTSSSSSLSSLSSPRRKISYKTQSRLIELLLFFQEGKSLHFSSVNGQSPPLFWGIHPLDGYFFFLQTIGYDPQTVVDLLLSMDHQELGGLLAVTVSVFRYYTASSSSVFSNREKLLDHWRRKSQGRLLWQQQEANFDDADDDDDDNTELDQVAEAAQELSLQDREKKDADNASTKQSAAASLATTSPHRRGEETDEEEGEEEGKGEDWIVTLAQAHFCLDEVLVKLQALCRQDLLPFNPRVLIAVLKDMTELMDGFLIEK